VAARWQWAWQDEEAEDSGTEAGAAREPALLSPGYSETSNPERTNKHLQAVQDADFERFV